VWELLEWTGKRKTCKNDKQANINPKIIKQEKGFKHLGNLTLFPFMLKIQLLIKLLP
jgi:hypothetical protein